MTVHDDDTPITIELELRDGERRTMIVDPKRPRTPVASPGEALEAHLRLANWLTQNPRAADVAEILARHVTDTPNDDGGLEPDAMLAMLTATLRVADTVYVSHDMCTLVTAIGDTFATDGVPILHETDVPYHHGFAILGRTLAATTDPLLVANVRARGLAWTMYRPGEPITIRTDRYTIEVNGRPGSPTAAVIEHGGIVVREYYDAGDYLVEPGAFDAYGRPPMIPGATIAIPFGVPVPMVDGSVDQEQVVTFTVALFRLMWQRILNPSLWRPPRAMRRRFERMVPRFDDGDEFKVVHLRRYEPGWGDPVATPAGR